LEVVEEALTLVEEPDVEFEGPGEVEGVRE
jgi:hypothetical protein